MFWAAWHLAFAFLTTWLDKTTTGNNSDSTQAATGVNTHAKQTRAWRFDKDSHSEFLLGYTLRIDAY